MPVILRRQDEIEAWMTAPPNEALTLQRPLPDDALRMVARGRKQDSSPEDQRLALT
jgi:putative SOS response-associated peptidase YedK